MYIKKKLKYQILLLYQFCVKYRKTQVYHIRQTTYYSPVIIEKRPWNKQFYYRKIKKVPSRSLKSNFLSYLITIYLVIYYLKMI